MSPFATPPAVARPALSRRNFSAILAAGAAGLMAPRSAEAEVRPAATNVSVGAPPSGTVIKINQNENPLGPAKSALAAIAAVGVDGGRYSMARQELLRERIAEVEGVSKELVMLFAGTSDPLHRAVISYTSADASYVMAEPSYEAGAKATKVSGARIIRVPILADNTYDVKAMAAADPAAGLIYFCNPNNPTGTLTSRENIAWLLEHKPKGSVLLIDEAYIQYTLEPSSAPLVTNHDDILVLKTFSKLYGLAGTRLGYVIAQPAIQEKLAMWSGGANGISQHAVAAGLASLNDAGLLAERRAYANSVRDETYAFFRKNGYKYRPSLINMVMVDVGRPANEVRAALAEKGILILPPWSGSPNEVRASLGTHEEMRTFCAALKAFVA